MWPQVKLNLRSEGKYFLPPGSVYFENLSYHQQKEGVGNYDVCFCSILFQ